MNNFRISTPKFYYVAQYDIVPSGSITQWPAASPPAGYLLCDGSAVSRTSYGRLFATISTLYGAGDGSTTFNLPNLVSRLPLGAGGSHALASSGGSETQALTSVNQIPAHNHGILDPGHSHTSNAIGGQGNLGLCVADGSNTVVETDGSAGELNVWTTPRALAINSSTTGITTALTGGSPVESFNVMNPYLSLNYIIKT